MKKHKTISPCFAFILALFVGIFSGFATVFEVLTNSSNTSSSYSGILMTCPSNMSVETDSGMCSASGVVLSLPSPNQSFVSYLFANDDPVTYLIGVTDIIWII